MFVEGVNAASGDAESRIAKGTFKPVAWSPASSLWGRLLNFEADQPYTPDDDPVDRAHAARDRDVGADGAGARLAAEAARLRRRPQARDLAARAGRRTASRSSAPSSSSTPTRTSRPPGCRPSSPSTTPRLGKKEGLTEKDIANPKARKEVRDIERSIVHYGDTTLFIADQLQAGGPGLRLRGGDGGGRRCSTSTSTRGDRDKLVAIYPEEGTFYSDTPFFTLGRAVGDGGAEGGRGRRSRSTSPTRSRPSWRRSTASAPPTARRRRSRRSRSPTAPTRSSRRACSTPPEPRVLAAIKNAWRRDRKPANILLVLDTSGSMNDEQRLERAKAGLDVFFKQRRAAGRASG